MNKHSVSISKNVEFVIVRAFPTSDETRKDYGIYANFSAKLLVDNIPFVSLNDLRLQVSREGETFIGSNGRQIARGTLWSIGFFPGSADTDEGIERSANFITNVSKVVAEFIKDAQENLANRERVVPEDMKRFSGIKPLTPRGHSSKERAEKNNFGDMPF